MTNTDDAAGITVTPTSGLTTTEAGGTATFTVVLNTQPTANVTIGLSSSDTTEGTVGPASLTFTTANWNTPQTVTVTGVNDDVDDGDVAYTIVTAAATSSDSNYSGAQRQRCRGHQHGRRRRRHHRHADQRTDDDGSGRHGHVHGPAQLAADGRVSRSAHLQRYDRRHGLARQPDLHRRQLEHAADGDGDRRE